MGEVHQAAAVLLKWMDDYADPEALALAIAQAEKTSRAVHRKTANIDAAQIAYLRRFVESIALDNMGLIRKLTAPANSDARCPKCNGRGYVQWHPYWDNGNDPCDMCNPAKEPRDD